MVSSEDRELFDLACNKIELGDYLQKGIGTLGEKTMHAVLKNFYEEDISHQEVRILNYVADIFRDDEIIEIQTRNLNAMRKKLDVFLPEYPVTIVYPIVHSKWLSWIDVESGEMTDKRKSNKTGNIFDTIIEIYKIRPYLSNPNLNICMPLIDVDEYRLLNGWSKDKKKGSCRYDRIPKKLVDEYFISSKEDFRIYLPEGLPEVFTTKDYIKLAKIKAKYGSRAISILKTVGIIEFVGKKGRQYLYKAR